VFSCRVYKYRIAVVLATIIFNYFLMAPRG